MNQRQNQIKHHFDSMYKQGVTPWKDHPPEPMLSDFFTFLKKQKPDAKLLDIGCGDGWISIQAAKQSFDVWGIDGSETAIKKAKETVKEKRLENKVQFQVGDALNLPFETGFFDALIDRGLFHHILPENRSVYLENITRVLKKNSFVYLAVFSMHNSPGIGQRITRELVQTLFSPHFEIVRFEEDPYQSDAPAHLLHFILRR